jgi:hypothetical protein
MKKLIIAVALCASTLAHAEVIATTPNNDGGKIVLTNEVCTDNGKTYKSLYSGYTYTTTGSTMNGCWTIEDDNIHFIYTDGAQYRYPSSRFTVKEKAKANNL